jgi:hypothetical protein
MLGNTVVIFGAGATKACGGPLTNEILPDVFDLRQQLEREGYLAKLEEFLVENFHLPPETERRSDHFPPLPLVLSLVDTALDRGDAFAQCWTTSDLRVVRESLEYAIFALLERRLRQIEHHYGRFLHALYEAAPQKVTLISLNYDIIPDNELARVADRRGMAALPDYGCDIATGLYRGMSKFGTLLKLHGSLNWLYCPNCHRLDIGVSPTGRRTVKVLNALYVAEPGLNLQNNYGCHGNPCEECGTYVRPVLITPTHAKDYRNPHVARVWYEAARALREASRAIFIGYSMPDDDVEVIYLFKRGLAKLEPQNITVVEYAPAGPRGIDDHPVGQRYRALFGKEIDWDTNGFEAWIDGAANRGFAPPLQR